MARLFGTDGVRGLANRDVTAELALSLSAAAAHELAERREETNGRMMAVVGRDPRASGEFLSSAVVAGLASAGVDVYDAGIVPTPAIAYLTKDLGADLGVMLSASHNPMPDNGIKFFAPGGLKLDDEVEDAIEARLGEQWDRPTGFRVGRVRRLGDANARYVAHLLSALPHRLDGLSVVIDAAHGAASTVSPQAFRAAGAKVKVIGAEPDGLNINDGYGSTHLEMLQTAVVENEADLGIAHDGDADRCLAVDHTGAPVDGDQIMAILTLGLKEVGGLPQDTLVTTVMSNLGLFQAMKAQGVTVRTTAVGDRYVLEDMLAGGYKIGGEQSGHVILMDHASTGDGTLTGLFLAARVAQTGRSLHDLASVMQRMPQSLINVRGVDKNAVDDNDVVQQAVKDVEAELGDTGRVLLRKSGTEPVVRVMVEASTHEDALSHATALADVVQRELGI